MTIAYLQISIHAVDDSLFIEDDLSSPPSLYAVCLIDKIVRVEIYARHTRALDVWTTAISELDSPGSHDRITKYDHEK